MLEHITGPTGLAIPHKSGLRNEKGVIPADGSSGSEELKEEGKKPNYLGDFDDALQY
jgi:hypothetical protein